MHNMVIGLFFLYLKQTKTGISYLDMLENYALPQLHYQAILRQDGALLHFNRIVTEHLDREMPGR